MKFCLASHLSCPLTHESCSLPSLTQHCSVSTTENPTVWEWHTINWRTSKFQACCKYDGLPKTFFFFFLDSYVILEVGNWRSQSFMRDSYPFGWLSCRVFPGARSWHSQDVLEQSSTTIVSPPIWFFWPAVQISSRARMFQIMTLQTVLYFCLSHGTQIKLANRK